MQARVNSQGTRLELEFRNFRQFVTELGPSISSDGLFVETTAPAKEGSTLDFTLRLEDGHTLIHGRGTVAWVRPATESPHPPPGMALKFLEILESSSDLIQQVVEAHLEEGGTPFDIDRRPEPASGPAKAGGPAAEETGAKPIEPPRFDTPPTPAPRPPEVPTSPPPDLKPAHHPPTASPAALPPEPSDTDQPTVEAVDLSTPPSPPPKVEAQAPPGPVRGAASAGRGKPRTLAVTPSLLALLVGAGIVGGLTYRLTENIVFLMTDVRGGTDSAAFGDIPPPEVLNAATAPTPPSEAPTLPKASSEDPLQTASGDASAAAESRDESPAAQDATVTKRVSGRQQTSPQTARAASESLSRIRFIQWQRRPDGSGTDVVLIGDGPIRSDRFEHASFGQRELIKVLKISWPYPRRVIEVGTAEIDRIRTGFHVRPSGNELHIVLDLSGPDISIREVRAEGRKLRLWIGSSSLADTADLPPSGKAVSETG